MNVAIIGGGYAGLAAATELAAHGFAPRVFEAAPTLGGRARRIRHRGLELDNGAHILLGAYRETLRLMRTVGVADRALKRLPLTWRIENNLRLVLPRLPAPLNLLAGLVLARGLTTRERIAAAQFIARLRRAGFEPDRDSTVARLLAENGQPERLVRLLWTPLCVAALNTPPGEASARVFLSVLRDALMQKRSDSDLLLPATDFSRLFPEAAARYVAERGGRVLLRSAVEAIVPRAGRFVLHQRGREHEADGVICAVGPHQAARLLRPLGALSGPVEQIAALAYEPICTVYLQYPGSVELPAPMLGLANGAAQWLFDRQALAGQRGLVAVVISAARAHGNDRIARLVADEMAVHFPEFGKPLWSKAIIERFATFRCLPNLERPENETPLAGLYLAGDYTASAYPATLESAVRSGVRCARLIAGER